MCIRDSLKSADFNKDYFTQIDIRTAKEIKLYSKRAELLTTCLLYTSGISPVLAGDETICKPLFGEVAEVYRNGLNRLANQPTKQMCIRDRFTPFA